MRLRTLLLALVLLVGLAACGGGDDDEASDEPTTTETDGATTDGATTDGATTGDDEGGGDAEAGAEVFAQAGCGSCHVLAAANSNGSIGPNLDEASPSFDKVVERVTEGSGAMPSFRDQLSEQQIQDVAAYVSASVED
jgi:mono/diheme cytochrome c family protein